jgi:hypothetical protein
MLMHIVIWIAMLLMKRYNKWLCRVHRTSRQPQRNSQYKYPLTARRGDYRHLYRCLCHNRLQICIRLVA